MASSPMSLRSARAPEDQRLSVIAEDADVHISGSSSTPPVPPRSTHRPFARRWRDAPPRASSDLKPPEYSTYDESRQKRDRLAELKEQPALARRGGWKRLVIIILLVIVLLAVALGVGLGVGLTRRKSRQDTSSNNGSFNAGPENQTFPAGQYSIAAFLNSVETSCTENPATFRCYPYTTFNASQQASAISFNWVITEHGASYTISSSDNPFAISFANVTLDLVDSGLASERYTFSTKMDQVVIPSSQITTDNTQAECFYNGTILSAALFTKMNATIGSSQAVPSAASWQLWPFAAEINQTIAGGPNIPACYERTNGVQGTRITSGLAAQPTTSECGCFYGN